MDADEPPKTSSRQINGRQALHLLFPPSHQREPRRCILARPQGERGSARYGLVEARGFDRSGAAWKPVFVDPAVRARFLSAAKLTGCPNLVRRESRREEHSKDRPWAKRRGALRLSTTTSWPFSFLQAVGPLPWLQKDGPEREALIAHARLSHEKASGEAQSSICYRRCF